MKRFAVVSVAGGIVSNVVVGDDLVTVSAVVGECVEETEATGVSGIDYTWDGSTFTAPPEPQPQQATSGAMTPELEAALIAAGWAPPAS